MVPFEGAGGRAGVRVVQALDGEISRVAPREPARAARDGRRFLDVEDAGDSPSALARPVKSADSVSPLAAVK
jgi:hypothetical protein